MCEDTKLKAIHNFSLLFIIKLMLSSMCEDTKLKAIHNTWNFLLSLELLSSMCEDTKLKAIHNSPSTYLYSFSVVFNVRRY